MDKLQFIQPGYSGKCENDLKFLAGNFLNYELPRDKKYLLKYFKTPIEVSFIKYYYCFSENPESYLFFTDHTGLYCQPRWIKLLQKKLTKLVELHDSAADEMAFEELAKIEQGKHKLQYPVNKRRK